MKIHRPLFVVDNVVFAVKFCAIPSPLSSFYRGDFYLKANYGMGSANEPHQVLMSDCWAISSQFFRSLVTNVRDLGVSLDTILTPPVHYTALLNIKEKICFLSFIDPPHQEFAMEATPSNLRA